MTEKKTAEEFEAEQRAIPDDRLAEMAQNALSRLCETGGRTITMTVPPRIDDTDMVIAEVIKRFKAYAAQQKPEMPSAKDAEAEAENEQEIESLMQKVAYKEATDSDKERLAELWNKRQKSEIKMPTEQLQKLMNDISEWSDDQFGEGQRNPAIAYHLLKEVHELIEAIKVFQETNSIVHVTKSEKALKVLFFEYADCLMLLLDSASHMGLTADMLIDYAQQKLEINKSRKWGKPDENGVVEHIEP